MRAAQRGQRAWPPIVTETKPWTRWWWQGSAVEQLRRLFPDREIGAMLPFGPLYGQTVFVDAVLAIPPEIAFDACTHRDAVAMRWNDFVKIVHPIVGKVAAPAVDCVAECRLSYRV